MEKELTRSVISGNKFYLGQEELSLIIKRIIRHYRYHRNNEDPAAVVIPFIREVEGVPVSYETMVVGGEEHGTAKPKGRRKDGEAE